MKKFLLFIFLVILSSCLLLTSCGSDKPEEIPDDVPTSITVTFVVDGETYDTKTIQLGGSITLPTDPTKEGYTFVGWKTESGEAFSASTALTGNITLVADFEAVVVPPTTYTVTFKDGDTTLSTANVEEGQKVTKPTDPTKDGYTFVKWKTEAGAAYDFDASVTADLVLVAEFEAVVVPPTTYTVTFKDGDTTLSTANVEEGQKVTKPTDPTKTNYAFKNWTKEDGTTFDFDTAITSNLTLIAKFEVTAYVVTYKLGTTSVGTKTVTPGSDVPTKLYTDKALYAVKNEADTKNIQANKDIEVVETGYNFLSIGTTLSDQNTATMNQHKVTTTAKRLSWGCVFYQNDQYFEFKDQIVGDLNLYINIDKIGRSVDITVYVDGVEFNKLNISTATAKYSKRTLVAANIPEGYHTVKIVFNNFKTGDDAYSASSGVNATCIYMYEKTPTFTVKFVGEDGATVDTKSVVQGQKVEAITAPTLTLKTFIGWYNGDVAYDFNATVEDNLTLTAKYQGPQPIASPTVTISTEGVATWNEVENAKGYICVVNGQAKAEQTERTITLSDGETLQVIAVGADEMHTNSAASILQTFRAAISEGDEEWLNKNY